MRILKVVPTYTYKNGGVVHYVIEPWNATRASLNEFYCNSSKRERASYKLERVNCKDCISKFLKENPLNVNVIYRKDDILYKGYMEFQQSCFRIVLFQSDIISDFAKFKSEASNYINLKVAYKADQDIASQDMYRIDYNGYDIWIHRPTTSGLINDHLKGMALKLYQRSKKK